MTMMMNNMFSMFDPSSSYASMNSMITVFIIMSMKKSAYKGLAKMKKSTKLIKNFISKEVKELMEKKIKFSPPFFINFFLYFTIINMMAIFPHNFTISAQISISLTMSMSMWVSTMIFGWKNKFKNMMVHLTPMGTPNSLMNFMVVIETVSSIIRPITLSVRLSANMVAGHLLLSLLSSFSMISITYCTYSFIPMLMLLLLEMGVALVQSYVLMTLLILYQNETT